MPMIPELPVAMLACARIGAAHSVVFGGFSADALRDRIDDAEARVLITADGGWRRGDAVAAQAQRRRGAGRAARLDRARASSCAASATPRRTSHGRRARPLLARARRGPVDRTARPRRWTPRTCSSCCTPRARRRSPKGIMHTTGGYLTQVAFTHRTVFDLQAGDRRLLVRGRHRLGDRPQLHRLRPARQRRHERALRGDARLPRPGPLVGDHRALRGDDPLHRPDGDPHLHEVGRRVPRSATTCRACASSARSASRSTPRRGSGTGSDIGGGRCPIVDTWWQTETGAIMISPLPGRHDTQAGLAPPSPCPGSAPRSSTTPAPPSTAGAAT